MKTMRSVRNLGLGLVATAVILFTNTSVGDDVKGVTKVVKNDKILIPITGLQADAVAAVQSALMKLSHPAPAAKKDEAPIQMSVLEAAVVNVVEQRLELILAPGQELRLTEIEKTLARFEVRVNRDALAIADGVKLTLQCADSAATTADIETALRANKLFERIRVEKAERAGEFNVTLDRVSAKATLPSVTAAVEQASAKSRFQDLTWGVFKARPDKGANDGK